MKKLSASYSTMVFNFKIVAWKLTEFIQVNGLPTLSLVNTHADACTQMCVYI